jgi:hypothetical protein
VCNFEENGDPESAQGRRRPFGQSDRGGARRFVAIGRPRQSTFRTNALLCLGMILFCNCTDPQHAAVERLAAVAGARVIHLRLEALPATSLSIDTVPAFDVGGLNTTDPSREFDSKQGYLRAAPLRDGRVAVIDVWRLFVFNQHGTLTATTGKHGAGPREGLNLISVCATRGDTIVAWDLALRRVNVYSASGQFVRSIATRSGALPASGCFDDGSIVLRRRAALAGSVATAEVLTRMRLEGSSPRPLLQVPAESSDPIIPHDLQVVAAGDNLYVGNAEIGFLAVYAATGKLLRLVWIDDNPEVIPSAVRGAAIARMLPPTVTGREALTVRLQLLPARKTWPLFDRVEVDERGWEWIEAFRRAASSPDLWTAIDGKGIIQARLSIDPSLGYGSVTVLHFQSGEVLVRRRDKDGAFHITSLTLIPAPNK